MKTVRQKTGFVVDPKVETTYCLNCGVVWTDEDDPSYREIMQVPSKSDPRICVCCAHENQKTS